jgi:DNA-binding transcriptional LysR family regulator
MDSRIELRHLRYFLALADELHFGRAAQRLHIAQPALSQQIRQLERLLGAPLFTRTSRAVALTEAGRVLQPRAQETLARLTADLDEAARVSRGESGRLELAFVSSASGLVGSVLRRLTAERPGVLIELHEGFTSRVLDRLERGAADVAITRDAEPREGLTVRTVLDEPFVAVVPESHDLARADTVSAGQLAASPLILYRRVAGAGAQSATVPRGGRGARHPLPRLRLEHDPAVRRRRPRSHGGPRQCGDRAAIGRRRAAARRNARDERPSGGSPHR